MSNTNSTTCPCIGRIAKCHMSQSMITRWIILIIFLLINYSTIISIWLCFQISLPFIYTQCCHMDKCNYNTWPNMIFVGGPMYGIHVHNHMVNFKSYLIIEPFKKINWWIIILQTPHRKLVCHIGSTYVVTCHVVNHRWPLCPLWLQ